MNTGCLHVVEPKAVKYGEDQEENRKLDILDANTKCPKCNAKLTKYVHKVLDSVVALEDADAILKQFGISGGDSKKKAELAQTAYKEARKLTEAQHEKDVAKARGLILQSQTPVKV